MKPAQVPAAREIVMRRTDDVQVVIEPRAIGLEVAGKRYKLRLVAKDTADRESVFREGNLPVIQVLPAPAA